LFKPSKVAPEEIFKNIKDVIPSILFARPFLHTTSQAFEASAFSLLAPCMKKLFSWREKAND
jgi:hypothetical protein